MAIKVLIVEDSITQAMAIQDILEDMEEESYVVKWVNTYQAALTELLEKHYDVALVDHHLEGDDTGLELIAEALEGRCTIPLIIVTASENRTLDMDATKKGASGYLVKQFINATILERTIRYAIERKRVEVQLQETKAELDAQAQKLAFQNEQMQEDLDLAAEFQKSILPFFPENDFVEFDCCYLPYGGGVSGDIYDVSLNRDGDLNIFIGDATGHGVAAAFMTMMIQIGLDSIQGNLPVSEVIRHLNQLMASREHGEKSITGTYIRISRDGTLQSALAGHPPTLILPADGSPIVQLCQGGAPLGIFWEELVPYTEESYQLQHGDKVFLYTDGITEWRNPQRKMFDMENLVAYLEEHRDLDCGLLLSKLLDRVKEWSENTPCPDDLTLLGFHYVGK